MAEPGSGVGPLSTRRTRVGVLVAGKSPTEIGAITTLAPRLPPPALSPTQPSMVTTPRLAGAIGAATRSERNFDTAKPAAKQASKAATMLSSDQVLRRASRPR